MKYRFIFLFLVYCSNANSQTVEKYFDFQWKPCDVAQARFYCTITKTDSGYVRNDYFIREKSLQMSGKYNDSDCNIPNGYFRFFHSNGILQSEGMYVNGLPVGLWLSYHHNGMMRDSSVYNHFGKLVGTSLSWHPNGYISDSIIWNEDGSGVKASWFENGNPSVAGLYSRRRMQHGKWKYYHNNGQISSIELFKEGTLLETTYYDEEGEIQADTANRNRNALFPGGNSAWQAYLFKTAYFPNQYKIVNADKAVVVVSFAIDEDGKVVDVFVSTPFYPAFDRVAENAISRSPKWKPAIEHNRRVKSWFQQLVTFSQE